MDIEKVLEEMEKWRTFKIDMNLFKIDMVLLEDNTKFKILYLGCMLLKERMSKPPIVIYGSVS